MLFAPNGTFIYSGKASDLKGRISYHFSSREENPLIRLLLSYVVWQVTATEDEAAALEGKLYDEWVDATGIPPLCNRIPPPESTLNEKEALSSRIQRLAQLINKTKL